MNKRMTQRNKDGRAFFPRCFEEPCFGTGCKSDSCDFFDRVCEKLAALEEEEDRREKGCFWCKEQVGEFGDTSVTASEIKVISQDRFGKRELPRKYCSVCGRKLEVGTNDD